VTTIFYCTVVKDFTQFGADKIHFWHKFSTGTKIGAHFWHKFGTIGTIFLNLALF
jgi:hypothetical protein